MRERFAVVAVLLMGFGTIRAADIPASDAGRNPRTVYITVGDYQDLLYTPMDSKASIEAAFDVMHKDYGVTRVWWRGGQDEVWGNQFVIREQSRRYERVWNWWRDLQYRVVKTNAIAVKAGHDRGVEVWMAYGLFDNGSSPDVGFGGFPYAAEDKIRVEHPEWIPVNKYGTWKQGGPIEFAYPGARKAMVDYLSKYVIDGGYDGIAFLSYVENYSQRYEDEFGYSQPIVDEFMKRYGVDIRTQSFDRDAWAKLRGEYLTQFMRELHTALKGRKIAVSVDGKNPRLPCIWNVGGGVRTVGHLDMDTGTWVREGIVDEVNLFYPNTDQTLASVIKTCENTKSTVSVFGHTKGDLPPGVGRIMTINYELESGFPWENYIDFPEENVPVQPESALKSDDVYARRRILTSIQKGKQTAKAAEVIPLLKDKDIYVRRAALRALATIKDPAAIPAIEPCLKDPENGVRWQAAVVLGQLNAPKVVRSLFEVAASENGNYQWTFLVVPEVLRDLKKRGKLTNADFQTIVAGTSHKTDGVRETAWHSIKLLAPPPEAGVEAAALRCLTQDTDAYARELALASLSNVGPTPSVLEAVRATLKNDKDVVVQVHAATTLAGLTRSAGTDEVRRQTLAQLTEFFRQYRADSTRADKDWGWREVGNAIRALGPDGNKALLQIMADKNDQHLADLAWRVIYLRQEDGFCFVTEEADREAHAKHPFLKFEGVTQN